LDNTSRMSSLGTCIEPNYVVPGANPDPCGGGGGPNPLNLPPTEAGNIRTSFEAVTEWSLTFTPGAYTQSITCSVVPTAGGPVITGSINGNTASFAGLTPNTAYDATIVCTNQFGSTPNTPPFAFTSGVDPGLPTGIAVAYCGVEGILQIIYTPSPTATSYTAVMNAVAPSTFRIFGTPTISINHFTFTGYPLDKNYPVTITMTASNAYGTNTSAPITSTTFAPLAGNFTSANIPMYPFGTAGYTSPNIPIPMPSDYSALSNATRFSQAFGSSPIELRIFAGVAMNNLPPNPLSFTLFNATTGQPCGFRCDLNLPAGNQTLGFGTKYSWTSAIGPSSIAVGLGPGTTLYTAFVLPNLGAWSSFSRYTISFRYNQGVGVLIT
jgi:hypothetical protein